MYNPFIQQNSSKVTDEALVTSAVKGNRSALDELVKRHQEWIYNIALRMVFNPQDAEDVTQEVLIKIITNLSSFKGKSSFRTWVYRIVANHVINMKKMGAEKRLLSFDSYGKGIDKTPDMDLPPQYTASIDLPIIIEEIKIHCMMAMLLCLDRKQRLVFILGSIFEVNDKIGSEILGISKDSFRQKLSRARRQVYNFMQEKCGLIKKNNPCHCHKKAKALIDYGAIDPNNLMFNRNYVYMVKDVSKNKQKQLTNLLDSKCQKLFRKHPFQIPKDFSQSIKDILYSNELKDIINL